MNFITELMIHITKSLFVNNLRNIMIMDIYMKKVKSNYIVNIVIFS